MTSWSSSSALWWEQYHIKPSPHPGPVLWSCDVDTHLIIKMADCEVTHTDDDLMEQFLSIMVGTVPYQVAGYVSEL